MNMETPEEIKTFWTPEMHRQYWADDSRGGGQGYGYYESYGCPVHFHGHSEEHRSCSCRWIQCEEETFSEHRWRKATQRQLAAA